MTTYRYKFEVNGPDAHLVHGALRQLAQRSRRTVPQLLEVLVKETVRAYGQALESPADHAAEHEPTVGGDAPDGGDSSPPRA